MRKPSLDISPTYGFTELGANRMTFFMHDAVPDASPNRARRRLHLCVGGPTIALAREAVVILLFHRSCASVGVSPILAKSPATRSPIQKRCTKQLKSTP